MFLVDDPEDMELTYSDHPAHCYKPRKYIRKPETALSPEAAPKREPSLLDVFQKIHASAGEDKGDFGVDDFHETLIKSQVASSLNEPDPSTPAQNASISTP